MSLLHVAVHQDSVDDLSVITMSDKAEPQADLSKFAPGTKSSGSLKNSSESDLKPTAVSSVDPFSGTARTTAVETVGMRGMSNGQSAGEHSSVSSLWSDMAAVQLGGSDVIAYRGPHMSLYTPLMVSSACV